MQLGWGDLLASCFLLAWLCDGICFEGDPFSSNFWSLCPHCSAQELGMNLVLVHYRAVQGGQWLMCISSSFLNTGNTGSLSCLLFGTILQYTNQYPGICSCDSLCFCSILKNCNWYFELTFLFTKCHSKHWKRKFLLIIFSHNFPTASVAVDMTSFLSMCLLIRHLVWVFENPRFYLHFPVFTPALTTWRLFKKCW